MDMICWVLTDLSGNVGQAEVRVGHDPTPEQVTPPRGRMETQNQSPRRGDPAREERLGLLCQGSRWRAGGHLLCCDAFAKGPGQSPCGLSREGKNGRGFLGFKAIIC